MLRILKTSLAFVIRCMLATFQPFSMSDFLPSLHLTSVCTALVNNEISFFVLLLLKLYKTRLKSDSVLDRESRLISKHLNAISKHLMPHLFYASSI